MYIDGFNLYYGGRGLCGKGTVGWRWLDVRALAARLVANNSTWTGATIERVVYCTAVISGADNPVGNREQDAYLRALRRSQTTDRIELGNYVHRIARAPLATPNRNGRPVLVHLLTVAVGAVDGVMVDADGSDVAKALSAWRAGPSSAGWRRRRCGDVAGSVIQSWPVSVTAMRAAFSSTIADFAAKAAVRACTARLLTARG